MALVMKNVMVNGRRTSMRLETIIWSALDKIAVKEGVTVSALISGLDAFPAPNLASEVRIFVAHYFLEAATDDGHDAAGHGCGNPVAAFWRATKPAPVASLPVEIAAAA
ncbi:putative DNA-binding ribbon-helix-helix protein [Azospirillum agricola]|uniref:ribbon-helix-helix domain-containing protein n=1 Tax=Azospirillum agricola TaxID=1720247 RepID=UPI001AE4739A|nr:ribbon-helix-helix domain-containing protein [Azospirillum agricola]MBP2232496.1 putative DNA-binding ribbon-helix-helix protein [Azospirillum agricola]